MKDIIDQIARNSLHADAEQKARSAANGLNHAIAKLARAAEMLGSGDGEQYEGAYSLIAAVQCEALLDAQSDASLAACYAKIARGAA